MKNKNIAYILFALFSVTAMSCETDTLPDPEVEYSPVWPISGEWVVHVMNENGSPASEEILIMRTYNTAENTADSIWVKLGDDETPFGILGKADCDVPARTFAIQNGRNILFKDKEFTVQEGKVLLEQVTLPSNTVADSIFMKYTSENTGKTYTVSGHRRSGFSEDIY